MDIIVCTKDTIAIFVEFQLQIIGPLGYVLEFLFLNVSQQDFMKFLCEGFYPDGFQFPPPVATPNFSTMLPKPMLLIFDTHHQLLPKENGTFFFFFFLFFLNSLFYCNKGNYKRRSTRSLDGLRSSSFTCDQFDQEVHPVQSGRSIKIPVSRRLIYHALWCCSLLEEGGTTLTFEGDERKCPLKIVLKVNNPQFYWKVCSFNLSMLGSFLYGSHACNIFFFFLVGRMHATYYC